MDESIILPPCRIHSDVSFKTHPGSVGTELNTEKPASSVPIPDETPKRDPPRRGGSFILDVQLSR
jgi:hypothetical protein